MASKRGVLSKNKVTTEMALALNRAAALMQQKRQATMSAETLLLAFVLTPEVEAHQLLRDFSRELRFAWNRLERDADRLAGDRRPARDVDFDFVTDDGRTVPLGREMLIVLDEGLGLVEAQGESRCSSAAALAVMTNISVGTHWLLNRLGITQKLVLARLTGPAPAVNYAAPTPNRQPMPLYHRQELQAKLINLLSMKTERNVILVGPPGVGKRSLVLSLGQLMAQGKGPIGLKTVVELSESALLDDALAAVQSGLRRAQQGILFAPDIARFFGGIRADFREEACNALQKAFFTGQAVIIGTAPEEVYNQKLSKTRSIAEYSQVMRVPPASVEETVQILNSLRPKFETDYSLTLVDESLAEAARLAERYYTVRPMPGAAVHLLHRACALLKTSPRTGTDPVEADNRLDPDDVMVAASLLTGIPVTNMGADERNRYVNMVDHLHQRIIGQDEAVTALSRAVKMARVGLKDPQRPIGSFLFLGPTGVGKTELAKALAEFMFGTERALITLDMSEYMEPSSVNRLIGSPPGYVGHEAGGQLTDAVKKQPYSVVLFDEVEKAHSKVFDTLLQVMDEGRLTSSQGETVRFSDCVILMTSNIGGEHLAEPKLSENLPDLGANGDYEPQKPGYDLNRIKTLLTAAFDAQGLLALCQEEPRFQPVLEKLERAVAQDEAEAGDQPETPEEVGETMETVEESGESEEAKESKESKESNEEAGVILDPQKGFVGSRAEKPLPQPGKAALIEALVAHVEAREQHELLLELVRRVRPETYRTHEPYYNWAFACEKAAQKLRSHFRPEFLNRLDDIIYFHPLSNAHLQQILDLMLAREVKLLKNQSLNLQLSQPAKRWLLAQNEHPEWGARPLRRLIQRHIREPLADFLLQNNPEADVSIKVELQGDKLAFSQQESSD